MTWDLQSKRRKGGKGGPAPPFWILNASDFLQNATRMVVTSCMLYDIQCMLTLSSLNVGDEKSYENERKGFFHVSWKEAQKLWLRVGMEDTAECWWEGLEWYETEIHLQGISCADNDFRLKTEEEADRQDKTQAGQLNAPAHAVPGSNMELSLVNMEKEKKDTFYFSSCQLVFDRLEEIPKQCTRAPACLIHFLIERILLASLWSDALGVTAV